MAAGRRRVRIGVRLNSCIGLLRSQNGHRGCHHGPESGACVSQNCHGHFVQRRCHRKTPMRTPAAGPVAVLFCTPPDRRDRRRAVFDEFVLALFLLPATLKPWIILPYEPSWCLPSRTLPASPASCSAASPVITPQITPDQCSGSGSCSTWSYRVSRSMRISGRSGSDHRRRRMGEMIL